MAYFLRRFFMEKNYGGEKNKYRLKKKGDFKKKGNIRFSDDSGAFSVDKSLSGDENEDSVFLSRSKDYSFLPVKDPSDFRGESLVKTDVVVFDRKTTSEYNVEREELKDDLLEWQKRHKERRSKEQL